MRVREREDREMKKTRGREGERENGATVRAEEGLEEGTE